MAHIDTTAYGVEFEKFIRGEPFRSGFPDVVGSFDPADVRVIRDSGIAIPYDTRTLPAFLEGGVAPAVIDALLRTTVAFSEHCGSPVSSFSQVEDMGIDTRYGVFHRGLNRDFDLQGPHLDTVEDWHEFDPTFITTAVIGTPGQAFVGTARRDLNSEYCHVELLDGELIPLREGVSYRLSPVCVHEEAELPAVPESRFFWRHFHH